MDHPLRLEYVDPNDLIRGANRKNWHTHGPSQIAVFEGLLAEVGWTGAALFNERTERMLDGHMRTRKAVELRLPVVPVLVGSWDEAQESKILASLDTLGLMAGIDPKAWDNLLREVDTGCTELMALFSDLSEEWGTIPKDNQGAGADEDDEDDFVEVTEDAPGAESSAPGAGSEPDSEDPGVPDVVFPGDNLWDIPTLDLKRQADAPDFPLTVWGSVGRKRTMPGTWCFYTADRRFASIWKNPRHVLESGAVAIVEPNFSTHPQMPRARVLWDVFKKRWLARYWQTQGLRVFVDVNVGEEVRDLNFLGVPKGWRAFATRSHSKGQWIEAEWEAAADHSGREDLVFLVYGGGAEVKSLCAKRGWHWCPEEADVARGKVKS